MKTQRSAHGLLLSTTSNEACKLYDAALTQYLGFYDDDLYGGLKATVTKMQRADPNFVLGRALGCELALVSVSQTTRLNEDLKQSVDDMVKLASESALTPREKMLVDAVQYMASSQLDKVVQTLEDVLVDHPTDIFALRFHNDVCLYRGKMNEMRDTWARCLPFWNAQTPLYENFLSHLAFAYEETGYYNEATKTATESLRLNRHCGWSTHTLAHVFEMQSRPDEGINLLSSTEDEWQFSNFITGHNYWHWALYHVEKGEFEAALSVFDDHIVKSLSPKSMITIYDTSSLLYRLQLEGVDVGDRWHNVVEASKVHVEDHVNSFVDFHLLMAFVCGREEKAKDKFLVTLKEWIRSGSGSFHSVSCTTGQAVVDAILAYDQGQYAQTVESLLSVRYNLSDIGGSYAQTDVLNLLLIHAAMKSHDKRHNRLARMLMAERDAVRQNSSMMERLRAQTLASCSEDDV